MLQTLYFTSTAITTTTDTAIVTTAITISVPPAAVRSLPSDDCAAVETPGSLEGVGEGYDREGEVGGDCVLGAHSEPCMTVTSHSELIRTVVFLWSPSTIRGSPAIHVFRYPTISEVSLEGVACSNKRRLILAGLSGKHWRMIWLRLLAENPQSQRLSTPAPTAAATDWSTPPLDPLCVGVTLK